MKAKKVRKLIDKYYNKYGKKEEDETTLEHFQEFLQDLEKLKKQEK